MAERGRKRFRELTDGQREAERDLECCQIAESGRKRFGELAD